MKRAIKPLSFLVFTGSLLSLVVATAAPGGGGGGPGGSAGTLYGDLYVIERDGAGVPVTRPVTYLDPETGDEVTENCLQPTVSKEYLRWACTFLPLNGEKEDFDPEVEDACGVQTQYLDYVQEVSFGRESVARAPAAVLDASYGEALASINAATGGQCACDLSCSGLDPRAVRRDAAGRIELCLALEDESEFEWKTIDAPLENLGLYRDVMLNGCLGTVTEEAMGDEGQSVVVTTALDPSGIFYLGDSGLGTLVCGYDAAIPTTAEEAEQQEGACTVTPDVVNGQPDEPCWWETPLTPEDVSGSDLTVAAVFVAAAADKTSPVTVDEVVNLNTYLNINTLSTVGLLPNEDPVIEYFPFTDPFGPGGWFGYTRGQDAAVPGTMTRLLVSYYNGLAFLASDVDVFGPSPPGVALWAVNIPVCRDGDPLLVKPWLFEVCNDAMHNSVYSATNHLGCGGVNWFTQAAEDARKTIWYLHNWSVPEIGY